jgi:predicted Rossmann-fold nucleotide-binding protein
MDEMFEILTLQQTQKLEHKTIILLYGTEYWDRVFNVESLVEWGAISPQDPRLLVRVNTVDEAFLALRAHLETVLAIEKENVKTPALARTRK